MTSVDVPSGNSAVPPSGVLTVMVIQLTHLGAVGFAELITSR